ncbi:LysR substrate-binding domain-containing protein [Shewanella atlantica]|uniref:LysR substrate-binding domain-containing protein n=1 Tax=Shewanella atlantica TaxID=271099 RepID=UPI003735EE38
MSKFKQNNLFDIQVFVLIYESLNSTLVGQALNVPASKISRSLKALRHSLDAPLFIRKQHGFERSQFADEIYPSMKRIIQITENCGRLNVESDNNHKKEIVIACPPLLSSNLSRLLQDKATEHQKNYLFNIKPCTADIGNLVKQKEIDLAITHRAYNTEQLQSDFICEGESLFLVGNRSHPIWETVNPTALENILEQAYIVIDAPEFSDPRDPLEFYAKDQGKELNIQAKVSGIADLASLLESGHAMALLSSLSAISFLNKSSDIRSMRLSAEQQQQLCQRSGLPRHYLTKRKQNHQIPSWLQLAITQFIFDNTASKA